MLSRILAGGRVSLLVGVISVAAATVLGAPLGLVSGFLGGWTDSAIMRCTDVLLAFPGLLLALAITAALGSSLPTTIAAIAIVNTPILARVARGQAMALRNLDYVMAERALGFGDWSILRHCFATKAVGAGPWKLASGMLNEARPEADQGKRAALYKRIQARIIAEAPMLFLHFDAILQASSSRLNWTQYPDAVLRLYDARLG